MHCKIALYFSLGVLFYVLLLNAGSLTTFYIFYLLLGLSVLLTALIFRTMRRNGVAVKSKYWNKILFQLSFNLQGNNAYVWGKNHNESHHLYTNIEAVILMYWIILLVRMIDTQPLKWFHRFQYLYVPVLYLLYSLKLVFIQGKH